MLDEVAKDRLYRAGFDRAATGTSVGALNSPPWHLDRGGLDSHEMELFLAMAGRHRDGPRHAGFRC